jgi:hypothetical protein
MPLTVTLLVLLTAPARIQVMSDTTIELMLKDCQFDFNNVRVACFIRLKGI